ncbi:MAG TPA: FHA domain-containing protein [Thermoanaerobaculia bacterium]|nr:FHA domain-containing protein [Thermoanaerobaculia bacterium]
MRVRFGECVLDSDTRQLSVRGEAVHLSPKAFQLLELLLENRPNVLSKSEIHEHLWPGTFVSDGALASLLVEVRSAIGDSARESRFVRTVHRFGYAFSGGAEEIRGSAPVAGNRKLIYRLIWGNREIALNHGANLLGRDEASIVWIDDALVSRRHARIVIDERGAVLEDLESKNGTYVRGKRIEGPTRLADEDEVTIGPASMVFRVFEQTASTATAVDT